MSTSFVCSSFLVRMNFPLILVLDIPQNSEQTTTLVATLNGTIHVVDPKSEKVLCSQVTGALLFTSYHTPSRVSIIMNLDLDLFNTWIV